MLPKRAVFFLMGKVKGKKRPAQKKKIDGQSNKEDGSTQEFYTIPNSALHYQLCFALNIPPGAVNKMVTFSFLAFQPVCSPRQSCLCLSHRTHLANTGMPVIVLH